MSDLPRCYRSLKRGQLWLKPASVGGRLAVDMTDDARAILEVAAAQIGLTLSAMIERDFAALQRCWLGTYGFDAPEGTWRGRFDHRQKGRKKGFLHCYFTDLDTGKRHILTVFANNRHRPQQAGPDFQHEALTGAAFRLTTARSKSGFLNLVHAEPDTGAQGDSWAMAPDPAQRHRPDAGTAPKTAILAAFKATGPVCRPRRRRQRPGL